MANLLTIRKDPAAAALFRGLGDRTRLAIILELAAGEQRVTDLAGSLGLVQSTVSTHLACLRDCGLVAGRPEGRQMFYRLAIPEIYQLLLAADVVLECTGHAPVLCSDYGE